MANTKITTNVIADDAITTAKIADDVALGGNPTTTTQSAGNNTTRVATTAFVTTAIAAINTSSAADDISTGDAAVTIGTSSGNITLDSPASIKLNADGGQIAFEDGSTEIGVFENSSSDFQIESKVQDKDIKFVGNDNGSAVTALTLDMSDAGTAIFNHDIVLGDDDVIKLGDSTGDLELYHIGGSVSVLRSTPALVVQSDDYISLGTFSGGELMLKATKNGAVDIYHDNVIQATTTTAGLSLPTTPMFDAGRNAGYVTDDQNFIQDYARTNVGSHYNTSNGRFTAPVDGRYFIGFRIFTHDSGSVVQAEVTLKKNSGSALIARAHKVGAYHTPVQAGLVLTLSANDYVYTYVGDSGTSSGWQGSAHEYNYFTGFLIG